MRQVRKRKLEVLSHVKVWLRCGAARSRAQDLKDKIRQIQAELTELDLIPIIKCGMEN